MQSAIGIDLGTTCARVAVAECDKVVVLRDGAGQKVTPAAIGVTQTGRRLVGSTAKRQAISNARNTATAVRRFLGRSWSSPEATRAAATSSCDVRQGSLGEPRFFLGGEGIDAVQAVAMLIEQLRSIAEDYLGRTVEGAVVTVPPYFDDVQRAAMRDACSLAGVSIRQLVDEPVAAALAFESAESTRCIAVCDFGGATFDCALVGTDPHGLRVLASGGDYFLGGDDLDARIVERLLWFFETSQRTVRIRKDNMAIQRLVDAAEIAKKQLSQSAVTEVHVPFLAPAPNGEPAHLRRTFHRGELEDLACDLVENAIRVCERVFAGAGVPPSAVDAVIAVGGTAHVPLVREALRQFFGRKPLEGPPPDEAVVMGAAMLARDTMAQSEPSRSVRPRGAASAPALGASGVTPLTRRTS